MRLDLWSPDGLRAVDVTIGQVSEPPGALAPGTEALFYRLLPQALGQRGAPGLRLDLARVPRGVARGHRLYEQAIADQEAAQREAAR